MGTSVALSQIAPRRRDNLHYVTSGEVVSCRVADVCLLVARFHRTTIRFEQIEFHTACFYISGFDTGKYILGLLQ